MAILKKNKSEDQKTYTSFFFHGSFIRSAQLNFSGPEFIFAKFWEILKKQSDGLVFKGWISRLENGLRLGKGEEEPGEVREGDTKLVR
jgi:hypothetical protein